MRAAVLANLIFSVLACHAGQEFPYVGYVSQSLAPLMSGPDDSFYPTNKLAWGTSLQVYQHLDETWSAVRPPDGSFSWIRAADVRILDDPSVGEVLGDSVATRVGSEISRRMDVEYVELKQGERIAILGSTRRTESGTPERWLKIAPPAGEFRWIRRAHLQRTPPHIDDAIDVSAAGRQDNSQTPASARNRRGTPLPRLVTHPRPETTPHPEALSTETSPTEALPAERSRQQTSRPPNRSTEPSESKNATSLEWEDLEGDQPESNIALTSSTNDQTGWSASGTNSTTQKAPSEPARLDNDLVQQKLLGGASIREHPAPARAGATSPPVGLVQADADMRRLRLLTDELDRMVQGNPATWRLQPIADDVMAVTRTTDSPEIQLRGLELLTSIDRFTAIAKQHTQLSIARVPQATEENSGERVSNTSPGTGVSPWADGINRLSSRVTSMFTVGGRPPIGNPVSQQIAPAQAVQPSVAATDLEPLYDGRGWLVSVITGRSGVPQYALTNQEGQILQFVEPGPGLNLRPYMKQEIGVFGRKQHNAEFNKTVVTAERIVSMKRHR